MTDPDENPRLSLLLGRVVSGEVGALSQLFDAAYPELRALAHARLRSRVPGSEGLETTALVHESFLRLAQRGDLQAEHRGQFFSYAGRVMRSVIVDTVRERRSARRGGGSEHAALTTQIPDQGLGAEQEILDVHEALDGLAEIDPRLVEIVQLRYFGGMTDLEIAEVLGVTDRTVRRLWDKARLLLLEALET